MICSLKQENDVLKEEGLQEKDIEKVVMMMMGDQLKLQEELAEAKKGLREGFILPPFDQ